MKYLLDTCVVSELIKKSPDANVVSWLQQQDESNLYLSVMTFGEIEKGIHQSTNIVQKKKLRVWLKDLSERFNGKVIPIDMHVALRWGEVQGPLVAKGKTLPVIDSLIAVSALANDCTVVTRNISDMERSGVEILNPWVES